MCICYALSKQNVIYEKQKVFMSTCFNFYKQMVIKKGSSVISVKYLTFSTCDIEQYHQYVSVSLSILIIKCLYTTSQLDRHNFKYTNVIFVTILHNTFWFTPVRVEFVYNNMNSITRT